MTRFCLTLPVPPSSNACYRHGPMGGYPGAVWKDYLAVAYPLLQEALEGADPDADHWWEVRITVYGHPLLGDCTNLAKPLLDVLGGARMAYPGEKTARGKSAAGKVMHGQGLYADDKRVRTLIITLAETHLPREDACVEIEAEWCDPPPRWKKPKSEKKGNQNASEPCLAV